MHHLSWRSVVEAAESTAVKSPIVSEHLKTCARCAERVREARDLLHVLDIAGSPEPSEGLVNHTWARLKHEMDRRSETETEGAIEPLTRALQRRLRVVWATLAADSWRPAPALRGTTGASARALIYETAEYGISLFISSEGGGRAPVLLGQVVPKAAGTVPAPSRAALVSDGATLDAQVSALGEFRFAELPPGDLHLAVDLGDLRIECPPFSLGSTPPSSRRPKTDDSV